MIGSNFEFSSPFIEERLYLQKRRTQNEIISVLVPFYRGAVVFELGIFSGCYESIVLVPFYRGAVVFAVYEKIGLQ